MRINSVQFSALAYYQVPRPQNKADLDKLIHGLMDNKRVKTIIEYEPDTVALNRDLFELPKDAPVLHGFVHFSVDDSVKKTDNPEWLAELLVQATSIGKFIKNNLLIKPKKSLK
ncbi:MAG: hypothetical protein U0003_00475 [Vampirovibrionales bacterium]